MQVVTILLKHLLKPKLNRKLILDLINTKTAVVIWNRLKQLSIQLEDILKK